MKAPAGDNATSASLLQAKITIPASSTATGGGAEAALLGKGRYKVWALAAIALLALWSMSAASVSLRWSAGDLAAFGSGDLDAPLRDDLDSLEMEEREKLVGRMWDMYTRTSDEVRLPRFWQEAFEAAYEELAGDDMQVRDAAISEIARMSAHRLELEQPVNANEHDDILEDVPDPSILTNKRKKGDETAATTDGDTTDDEIPINLIRKKARTAPQEPNTPAKEKTLVKIATTQENAKKNTSQEKTNKKTTVNKATTQENAKKKTPAKKTTI